MSYDRRVRARHVKAYRQRNYISPMATKHEVVNVAVPEAVQRFEGVPTPCGFCGAGRVLCAHRARLM